MQMDRYLKAKNTRDNYMELENPEEGCPYHLFRCLMNYLQQEQSNRDQVLYYTSPMSK
jgi:hypothetical protein